MHATDQTFQILLSQLLEKVEERCPECGSEQYVWQQKNKDGTERCAPTCWSCGYKMLKKHEQEATQQRSQESFMARTQKFFHQGSLIADDALRQCRLTNYQTTELETRQAKERALAAVSAIVEEKPIHVIFSGKPGVGKSHLAISILVEVLERSAYQKYCLFVSYSELLEKLKMSMNESAKSQAKAQAYITRMKKADVLVLDDLGAELGIKNKVSTDFNNDILNRILEARQNKATIFTTNFSGKQLVEAYGTRIISRLMKHASGYVFQYKDTTDKRMRSVK